MSYKNSTEKTRVQIPAMIHLLRLGYAYLPISTNSLDKRNFDKETNIEINIFKSQFKKLNPNFDQDIDKVLREIKWSLNNDDLGKDFYNNLVSQNVKLIDFENISNNVFHFSAELEFSNGDESFRPDITIFINGLPLAIIEVKIPNNKDGQLAEEKRMNDIRLSNKKFKRFFNLIQLMMFSNNMDYSVKGDKLSGSFYSTGSNNKVVFNRFKEEPVKNNPNYYYENFVYENVEKDIEKKILSDFNSEDILDSNEYKTNKDYLTYTNKFLTSLCSRERILFLIKYGIVYLNSEREEYGKRVTINEKHIARYQQIFACLAVKEKLEQGVKSGIIWHTQGSGKTALSYYFVKFLTNYFSKKNKVAKFYFIVDRIDLLEQAKQEFETRGLIVKTAENKKELLEQFNSYNANEGNSGKLEIVVVNIQRFSENDKQDLEILPYSTNLQRILIIDEAHRSYNIQGSFLANLINMDKNSIKLALTGTPLLKEEWTSMQIFGDYIHTYYYDKSINDGYTLQIIREDIDTYYKKNLQNISSNNFLHAQKNEVKKSFIKENDNYIEELLKYIIVDFYKFRKYYNDTTLGAMIICDSSVQAKKMNEKFDEIQKQISKEIKDEINFKKGLILHDVEDKETRKMLVNDFKKNFKIDILIVFNMLLTGFDAPRLKRLYFGRKLKAHSLLQAITRVNRPYREMKYGYIIDFVNIKENFDETNMKYLNELKRFNTGIAEEHGGQFKNIFLNREEIEEKVKRAHNILFNSYADNLEQFEKFLETRSDKKELFEIREILQDVRGYYNLAKSFDSELFKEEFKEIKIEDISQLISMLSRRISFINFQEEQNKNQEIKLITNEILSNLKFNFILSSREELKIVSNRIDEKIKEIERMFAKQIDKNDPKFMNIQELIFSKLNECNYKEIKSSKEYDEILKEIDLYKNKLEKIQIEDENLAKHYRNNSKMLFMHKWIRNINSSITTNDVLISKIDEEIKNSLLILEKEIEEKINKNADNLKKEDFFKKFIEFVISRNKINVSTKYKESFIKELINQYKEL
ncbi:HsdR family type I site-specific deoxyribonuclease [Mesomycoplasma molare]|uniref:Type I restriction enzyme endonuclease subunit n=1 Tax=Mesomycoplasma molare TaxID=171288 RepID=A0ABY5TUU3_9BACT|nr:HsdR family type I site-specific deoxyribonuclease [Mesomycoplasma molare]UWD34430.1 HsdR family type I site-specific deoxyribonuclease [Mesomycoplasma molare]